MKRATPKTLSANAAPKRTPDWENSLDEDFLSDPDTLQRKAAHEVCKEFDLPDFLDQHDFD